MTIRLARPSRALAFSFAFVATAAAAQSSERSPTATLIAIPHLATAKVEDTDVGSTWAIAGQIADLIAADLKSTESFIVASSKDVRIPSYPEVTAPSYPQWRSTGTKLLLSGFVNLRSDGRLTIGCYVYDVQSGREMARQGFAVAPGEWRRAAHRCADAVYVKATGNAPQFDSRIAYVAQSGSGDSVVKRLAVMDFDGASHSYLTPGDAIVLTPKWSPKADRIAYTSLADGGVHVRVVDVSSGNDRRLVNGSGESFAPAFSPDGRSVALSMSSNGNIDVYSVDSGGGYPRRLTTSSAIDTGPSYSPDGERIVFVSDRSGSPQLYVMNADGSDQRRISFGGGDYGAPAWSPDGSRIAFARSQGPVTRIGTMDADGSNERLVSAGPDDEQPAWSPDGSQVLFQARDSGSKRLVLAAVPAEGGEQRTVPTPQGATDPAWAERKE